MAIIATERNGISTPFGLHGKLHVEGSGLMNEANKICQLKGISTHNLSLYPEYINEACITDLTERFGISAFRLAMYSAEADDVKGYADSDDAHRAYLEKMILDAVKVCAKLGIYVLVDWHILLDYNPNIHADSAIQFFSNICPKLKEYDNVLYEICNEPNGGTGWKDIKAYAEEVIPVIRQYDDDAIIIVGTPNWSQYVDQAAADPITGYDNIMYALHFYAATHKDSLRKTMMAAIDAGLPVFVTEYGICDASGSGGIDEYQANEWVKTMNSYNVSYVAWNLSNKNETSAMISSGCNKVSGFSESDLSACGKWVYEMLTGKNAEELQGTPAQPNGGQSAGNQGGGQSGGGAGANQGNAGGNVPQTSTTTLTNGDISCSAEMANSWEAEGKTFYQYNLTLQNTSGTDCTSWLLKLTFSGNVELSSGWCGNYTVNGNVVQIGNVDYNGSIPAGGSVKDVGFIISGPAGLTLTQ